MSAVAISVGSFRDISPTTAFDARPLCSVQAVNIRPTMNRAVGARPGIEIEPIDRNGPGEVDPLLAAVPHRIDNGVAGGLACRYAVCPMDFCCLAPGGKLTRPRRLTNGDAGH